VYYRLDRGRGLVSWFAHSDFVIEHLLVGNGSQSSCVLRISRDCFAVLVDLLGSLLMARAIR
jgi:hypothetical protein